MRAFLFALLLAACASGERGSAARLAAGTTAADEGNGVWFVTCSGDATTCSQRADAACDGDFQVIESGPVENAGGVRTGHGMRVRCT